jgi:hypothetical protein
MAEPLKAESQIHDYDFCTGSIGNSDVRDQDA